MLGEEFAENPRFLVTADDWEMVRLWRLAHPPTGAGHLPDAGGTLDQAAAMMDAFALMTAAARELETDHGTETRR